MSGRRDAEVMDVTTLRHLVSTNSYLLTDATIQVDSTIRMRVLCSELSGVLHARWEHMVACQDHPVVRHALVVLCQDLRDVRDLLLAPPSSVAGVDLTKLAAGLTKLHWTVGASFADLFQAMESAPAMSVPIPFGDHGASGRMPVRSGGLTAAMRREQQQEQPSSVSQAREEDADESATGLNESRPWEWEKRRSAQQQRGTPGSQEQQQQQQQQKQKQQEDGRTGRRGRMGRTGQSGDPTEWQDRRSPGRSGVQPDGGRRRLRRAERICREADALFLGRGMEPNKAEAFRLYLTAAKLGSVGAMNCAGAAYVVVGSICR
jgi:hypothetical protein